MLWHSISPFILKQFSQQILIPTGSTCNNLHNDIYGSHISLAEYNGYKHYSRLNQILLGGHGFESRWSPDFFFFFQASSFQLLKLEKLTAMIILHFHLQPQFKYELFYINFTKLQQGDWSRCSSSYKCIFIVVKVSATLEDRPRADRCSAFIFPINPNKPDIFWKLNSSRLWFIPLKISKS